MKEIITLTVVLTVISALLAGILGAFYDFTKPYIEKAEKIEAEAARKIALPTAATFEEKTAGDLKYYIGKDEAGNVVGYTLSAYGNGYSSTIETVAGLTSDFAITAISVAKIQETPGLGMKATEKKFQDQYKNLKRSQLWIKKKDSSPDAAIDAISGSTITTRAITSSLRESIEKLEKALQVQ